MALITLPEFANRIGFSRQKVFRMVKSGELNVHMRKNGRNYFLEEDVDKYLNKPSIPNNDKKVVAYYRVSSSSQKPDLINQRKSIETFSINSGIVIDEYLSDIGSGMNFNRKNFNKILIMMMRKQISKLILTYEDRMVRFGFDIIRSIAKENNVEIIVINLKSTSPEEEMVEDLMTIIHVFSSRLYGLRKYKVKKNDLLSKDSDKTE